MRRFHGVGTSVVNCTVGSGVPVTFAGILDKEHSFTTTHAWQRVLHVENGQSAALVETGTHSKYGSVKSVTQRVGSVLYKTIYINFSWMRSRYVKMKNKYRQNPTLSTHAYFNGSKAQRAAYFAANAPEG
jgi:hypothetical protein